MRSRLFGILSVCGGLILAMGVPASGDTPPPAVASSWSAVTAPTVPTPQSVTLNTRGISCPTSNFCVAVGRQGMNATTFLEQWNGSAWSLAADATANQGAILDDVSCTGPSFCVAVGALNNDVLIETWNGSSWALGAPPSLPAGTVSAELFGVSCLRSDWCLAVGSSGTGSPARSTLSELWNGSSWQVVPTANIAAGFDQLDKLSCATPSFCLADGNQGTILPPNPLAEEWNGSTWTTVAVAPVPGSSGNTLDSVSCAGTSFCVLVGASASSGTTTLVETWDGQSLSVTSSPNTAGNVNSLSGVSCSSATSCTAVGTGGSYPGTQQNLALSWNGSSWAIVATPNGPASTPAMTDAVACLTDWACVAVGQYLTNPAQSENQPFVMWSPIARSGYRFVASDGGIFAYGAGAPFYGSMGGQPLNKPIVGMATMPAGDGYYLVASDGGIFSYGSAKFYGSMGGKPLNKPIVGIAVTADGAGYWLVASDGGIFSFGDAQFYGSSGALTLNKPIVGMATTPNGLGYYLVASDGGIFSYGNATFAGSMGGQPLNKPIVGMAVPVAGGYYLVASDGGIFSFPTGLAGPPFYGSTGAIALNKPVVGMSIANGGSGYYMGAADGGIFSFPEGPAGPTFYGSRGGQPLNAPIVAIAG